MRFIPSTAIALVLALTALGWLEEFNTDTDGTIGTALKTAAANLSRQLGNSHRPS